MLIPEEHVFSIMSALSNEAFLPVNMCKLAGAMEFAMCFSDTKEHMH